MKKIHVVIPSMLALALAAAVAPAMAQGYGAVTYTAPQRACVEQQGYVSQPTSGGGALLGALVGGVVGHDLGRGYGRGVSTGLGAIAGSVIGDRIEAANTPGSYGTVSTCRYVGSTVVAPAPVAYSPVYAPAYVPAYVSAYAPVYGGYYGHARYVERRGHEHRRHY